MKLSHGEIHTKRVQQRYVRQITENDTATFTAMFVKDVAPELQNAVSNSTHTSDKPTVHWFPSTRSSFLNREISTPKAKYTK